MRKQDIYDLSLDDFIKAKLDQIQSLPQTVCSILNLGNQEVINHLRDQWVLDYWQTNCERLRKKYGIRVPASQK
jgi:hypothetical protein